MRLPFRGPDTSMSLSAGTGSGRHRRDDRQCNRTWGECWARSKRDPESNPDGKKLPHICSEPGKHEIHICLGCGKEQVL